MIGRLHLLPLFAFASIVTADDTITCSTGIKFVFIDQGRFNIQQDGPAADSLQDVS